MASESMAVAAASEKDPNLLEATLQEPMASESMAVDAATEKDHNLLEATLQEPTASESMAVAAASEKDPNLLEATLQEPTASESMAVAAATEKNANLLEATLQEPMASESMAVAAATEKDPNLLEATLQEPTASESIAMATASEKNLNLLEAILQEPMASNWSAENREAAFALITLEKKSSEYIMVEDLFDRTSRRADVTSIQRVENPFLLGQYLMKKEKTKYTHSERSMFHSTKLGNVNEICRYNFDWRRRGLSRGHKFGQGVSFSPSVSFAQQFTRENVMFLVKVLVGFSCRGNLVTVLPPASYDTTDNGKGTVYVKYEDDDFYPQYVIYYEQYY